MGGIWNKFRNPPVPPARPQDYNLLISTRALAVAVSPAGRRAPNLWGKIMNLPKIDLSSLPDLDTLTGLFGSLLHTSRIVESDDSLVVLMAYVYEVINH
jgi:hypothetical protein